MTTKVVKGSIWTLAGQVGPLAVSFITTPFVIRMLGAESYGVLILVGLIPTYLAFADFGMGLASTKFASEAYAKGDPASEARIVRTAALIALCVSLPIALILIGFSSQIITLFNVPESANAEASLALKFATVAFVLNIFNAIFNTPQLTRLRMDLNTMVTAGFRILGLVATPFAVYLDGVVGATFVLMLAGALTLIGHLFISGRLDRYLFKLSIDRSAVRPLLKFGSAMVGAGIATVLLVNAEKGVLAATVSSLALAHYSVAFTLASMMTLFSTSLIQSLMPAFSQLQSADKLPYLNALYSRGIRLSLIWLVPSTGFLAIVARTFFSYWAGKEFADASTLPFYILLIGISFNVLSTLPAVAIMSAGRTDIFAKLNWLELAAYVVVVWFLASRYGAVGAAIAWTLRVTVDSLMMYFFAHRLTGVRYVHRTLLPFVFVTLFMLLPVAANFYTGYFGLVVAIEAVCLCLYGVFIFRNMLEAEEAAWLSRQFSYRFARFMP